MGSVGSGASAAAAPLAEGATVEPTPAAEPQEDSASLSSEEKAKLVEVFLEIQAAAADALTQLCQKNLEQKKEATGSSNSTARTEAHQMAFKAVVRVLSAVHLG
eukprot:RCo008535